MNDRPIDRYHAWVDRRQLVQIRGGALTAGESTVLAEGHVVAYQSEATLTIEDPAGLRSTWRAAAAAPIDEPMNPPPYGFSTGGPDRDFFRPENTMLIQPPSTAHLLRVDEHFTGAYVALDGTVYTLALDPYPAGGPFDLNPAVRAVLVTMLRQFADRLEEQQ